MTKQMNHSLVQQQIRIPKPFVVQASVLQIIQPCQVGGPGSATQATTPGTQPDGSVGNGAMIMCSYGTAPSAMVVVPPDRDANVSDTKPLNIPPFGMCSSIANPTVAAATAYANGVLTPQPCVPATAMYRWKNGSNGDDLQFSATLHCRWCGEISFVS